jgi:hypothetical protein
MVGVVFSVLGSDLGYGTSCQVPYYCELMSTSTTSTKSYNALFY